MANDAIYLNDVDIKEIFPSTKTKTINKLITENSLTRLLNRLLDVEGYIISSEFPTDVSNNYNYIPVTDLLSQSDLEFCIRGYYFNLGAFTGVLGKIQTQYGTLGAGDVIKASIYVDEISNPEYPELYGQNNYEPFTLIDSSNNFQFPQVCKTGTVSNLKCFDSSDELLQVEEITDPPSLSADRHLQDAQNQVIDLVSKGVKKITFVNHTEMPSIVIYQDIEGEKPTPPANTTEYSLTLFKYEEINNVVTPTIPISSLHRFSSLAISAVDGGIISNS